MAGETGFSSLDGDFKYIGLVYFWDFCWGFVYSFLGMGRLGLFFLYAGVDFAGTFLYAALLDLAH